MTVRYSFLLYRHPLCIYNEFHYNQATKELLALAATDDEPPIQVAKLPEKPAHSSNLLQ
jgi:hypothetical protein